MIAQALNIPQNELEKTLVNSFYVTVNKNYTATVRNLASFIDYLQRHPNDPDETFGQIRKEAIDADGREEDSNFYHNLLKIIGYVNGFAVFNRNPHQFVELTKAKETVSIKTKGGKLMTIAFMEGDGLANCADIQLHNSGMEPESNGVKDVPQFEVIGFNCGGTPIQKTPVTINCILLGDPIEKG